MRRIQALKHQLPFKGAHMSETLQDITAKVKLVGETYAKNCNIDRNNDWYLLKLTEELGELTQNYLTLTGRARDKGLEPETVKAELAAEASDVLGMLLLFCDHNNIDLEQAINDKWFQYLPEDKQHV